MSRQANAGEDTGRCSPVVELREYTLHPSTRETLIAIFDRYLVESQEETGMRVIGQFCDADRPDRFVWLRGFDSMEARKHALAAFYGGPVWAAHKDAANATMIAFDNVLLLKPAWTAAGFDLTGRVRGPRDAPPAVEPREGDLPAVLITIHHVRPQASDVFAAMFHDEAVPLLEMLGAPLATAFLSEHSENTFPHLPVRERENVLVAVQEFSCLAELERHKEAVTTDPASMTLESKLAPYRSREPQRLRLRPTARSLLGRQAAR